MVLLISLACIYQLSFTAATRIQEKKAADYAERAAVSIQKTKEFQEIDELDHAFFWIRSETLNKAIISIP